MALASSAVVAFSQTPPIKPQTPTASPGPAINISGPEMQELAGRELTSEEAARIALARSPRHRSAASAVRAAEGRVRQVRSGMNPAVQVSASASQSETIRGTGDSGVSTSAGLTLSQLLLDFGRTRMEVRQFETLVGATKAALLAEEAHIAADTKSAFYDALESADALSAAESNLANRQRQLELADARVGEGLGSPADLVRARAAHAEAVNQLEEARAASIRSLTILAELMGIDPRTPLKLSREGVEAPFQVEALEALVLEAGKTRPEIAEAKLRLQAAGFAVGSAQLSDAPRLSGFAELSGRGPDDRFTNAFSSLGIVLTWPIFDGGLKAGRNKEAKAAQEEARANLETISRQVIREVTQAFADVEASKRRIAAARVQFANAQELVRISEGRYRGEVGTFLEVTDAQSSLFAAERGLASALADYERAATRLRKAVGRRP